MKPMGTADPAGPTVVSGASKTPIYVIVIGVFITIILQVIDVARTSDSCPDVTVNTATAGLGGTSFTHAGNAAREDVFVIGVDGEWPPYCHAEIQNIPDSNSKQVVATGFLKDVAAAACTEANLDCRFPLYGKWTECFEQDGRVGQSLLNDHYDMCLCWTVTPSRLGTTIWPTNDDRGWTKQAEGGLLVKKAYQNDPSIKYGGTQQSMWDWLGMDWSDGCDGSLMTKVVDTSDNVVKDSGGRDRWEQCTDGEVKDSSTNECQIQCPQGKITIGYIAGWALKPASFDWVSIQKSGGPGAPDASRVIWIDEHDPNDGTGKTSMTDYAHVAAALSNDQIDAAYTYTNAIAAHLNTVCTICSDQAVWQKLAFRHSGLWFSSGGASGFFKYGQEAKRDKIGQAVDAYIAQTDKYCPLCNKYWPDAQECEDHCIGCSVADGTCSNKVAQSG